MSEKPKVVRLQSNTVRGYEHFYVTIPKEIIERLKWSKGDVLVVKVVEYEGREAIVIYRI